MTVPGPGVVQVVIVQSEAVQVGGEDTQTRQYHLLVMLSSLYFYVSSINSVCSVIVINHFLIILKYFSFLFTSTGMNY